MSSIRCRALAVSLVVSAVAGLDPAAAQVFGPPALLSNTVLTDSGGDQLSDVNTDGAGNWVAVWTSADSLGSTVGTDNDIFVSRSTDDGVTWTPPAPLNSNAATDSGDDGVPEVDTDGAGNWVVVWHSTDSLGGTIGTDYDILGRSGT